jgi:hypothetical protein
MAAMLSFGFAGQASAFFALDSLHFVAVGEEVIGTSHDVEDGAGEMHYDLGLFDPFFDGTQAAESWDTDIFLSDFSSDVSSWDQVFIGIYGAKDLSGILVTGLHGYGVTTDATSITPLTSAYTNFQDLVKSTDGYSNNPESKAKNAGDAYVNQTANQGGGYGNIVTVTGGTIGAEERLSSAGTGAMDLWVGDKADESSYMVAGTFTFLLDTFEDDGDAADNSLKVNYAPVPIPGSVLLLASGLLGLFGMRRKKS